MSQDEVRNRLLQCVQQGTMTPKDAESEAERQGFLLLLRPEGTEFDSLKLQEWTLAMVVAWIAWRRPEKVCEFWNDYRLATERWVLWPASAGYVPQPQDRASILSMVVLGEVPGPWSDQYLDMEKDLSTSWQELLAELKTGKLKASAVHIRSSATVEVPAEAWTQFDIGQHNWFGDKSGDVDALVSPRNPYQAIYSYPLIQAERVRKIWSRRIGRVRSTSATTNKCRIWLRQRMAESPNSAPHPKSWFADEARRKFGVGITSFNNLWRELTNSCAPAWARGGRPKKTPS